MPDENPNLDIRATLDSSGVTTGANTAVTGITSINSATVTAAEVAREYSTSLNVAERALLLLGDASKSAAIGSAELDAAVEQATAAFIASSTALAEKTKMQQAAVEADLLASGASEELGTVTSATSKKLAALGIEQSAVAASATEMGISMEVAAAAMIQIERARISETITEARIAMEGLTTATEVEAVAAEESATAHVLDAEALAQRAIMMRRTSDGLVDLAMGGRRAIQGIADLQFVLTKLFPGGAVTLGVLGGIALIGEIWEQMSLKMERQHNAATEKIKSNIDEIAKQMESRYTPVLERQLDLQKQIQAMQKDELGNIAAVFSAKEKSLELDKKIAIEKARQQELVELGSTKDEGERARIKARFNATETDINAGSEVATAQLELDTKQAEIDATKSALAEQQNELSKLRDQIQAIQDQRTADAQFLASRDIQTDKNGILIHKKTDSAGKDISTSALTDLKAAMEKANQDAVDIINLPKSAGVPRQFHSRDEWYESYAKKAENAQTTYEGAQSVQNRGLTTDSDKSVSDIQKHVDELSATVYQTSESLSKLAPAIENAQKGVEAATRSAINSQVASNQNSADVNAKYPPRYNSTKPVDDALGLAVGDANANTGINSGDQARQLTEVAGHIKDAVKAHQDISRFILQLMEIMQEYKIGSTADRDKIQNALTGFKVSSVPLN